MGIFDKLWLGQQAVEKSTSPGFEQLSSRTGERRRAPSFMIRSFPDLLLNCQPLSCSSRPHFNGLLGLGGSEPRGPVVKNVGFRTRLPCIPACALAGLMLAAVASAAAAEPKGPGAPAALAPPPGCWDAARAEGLERSLDAFFAEKSPAKRSELFTKDLAPQGVGLSLKELEAMARGAPPEGRRRRGAWRVQAPWAAKNPRAWFNLTMPKGYTPTRSWGLVMVLHSGPTGRNGDNLLSFYSPAANEAGFFAIYPTILNDRHLWDSPREIAWVFRILEWVARRYRIDFRRLVVSGISAGGMATWSHLALHPEVWSAGGSASAPPWTDSGSFERFRAVPLYLLQGERDRSIRMVRAAVKRLKASGAQYVYKEIPGAGHNLPRKLYREMIAWITHRKVKPFSPRPLVLPVGRQRSLWQRTADPLNMAGDPAWALMAAGKFADAKKLLDARIARSPGQAKDFMIRALARLPALVKPLPAALDAKRMVDGRDGWGAATEAAALADLQAALRCRQGRGEDPSAFEARVRVLAAKIHARRFVVSLLGGGYSWVDPFNRANAELREVFRLKRSSAEALALSRALKARLPKKLRRRKR